MDHPFSNLKRDAECEGDSDAENANLTPREFAAVLHPYLSKDFWRRSPLRAGYIPLAYAILYLHFHVTKLWLIEAASPAMWISSLFVCANMGTAWFFIMHEILHGAIFKSKSGSWLFAFLGGVPFLTTPHVWKRWHDQHHRLTASKDDTDRQIHPDFDSPSSLRNMLHNTFKSICRSNPIGLFITPLITISGHHAVMTVEGLLGKTKFKLERKQTVFEFVLIYTAALFPLGFLDLKLAFYGIYFPVLLSNLICNLYILSNHNTMPLTTMNWPLINSLSVFLKKGSEITHFGFGRHVEHHIFQGIAHSRLKELTNVLRTKYPQSFREESIITALKELFGRSSPTQTIIYSKKPEPTKVKHPSKTAA